MKLKIVCPTGLVKDVKIVNAETGELLDDVQEFTIHAKANAGLVEVQLKFNRLTFEVTAEKKKRTKLPKIFLNPTDYSISCISANEKTVMDGEGRVDLEYVRDNGLDPDDRLSWYLWKYFRKVFSEDKFIKMKTSDIRNFISGQLQLPTFDRTTVNHCINKFHFIGLLSRQKKADECIYTFAKIVKRRGLEWFRMDNKYLRGHFQSDKEGFFNLQEEIN